MIIEVLSVAMAAYVAYTVYGPSKSKGNVTETLNERIDNGYQLRDITYTTDIDLAHPDVKNNRLAMEGMVTNDRGVNGLQRAFSQLYGGTSEISQLYRTDNLFL